MIKKVSYDGRAEKKKENENGKTLESVKNWIFSLEYTLYICWEKFF